jgi:acetoin utilization deacetylase AcuC-like enzyme
MLPIVHHPAYCADIPEGHRFPMLKFKRLAEILIEKGLVTKNGYHTPGEATPSWLSLAHEMAYVDQVNAARVPKTIEREIGLPMTESVGRRARFATAGTVMAGRLALEHGLAANTAGGSHHARFEHGAGFCVFNDAAVAIRVMISDGLIETAMVIDLDVHQGDGTADIFENDTQVYTVSVHNEKNYPVRKKPGSLDIGLPDGMHDQAYLEVIRDMLPKAFNSFMPDIVFYNAGVDTHANDKLGRLNMTSSGIAERDRRVIDACLRRNIPIAGIIGGGYSTDIDELAERHAILHQAMAEFISS